MLITKKRLGKERICVLGVLIALLAFSMMVNPSSAQSGSCTDPLAGLAENYTFDNGMFASEEQVVPLGTLPAMLEGTLCLGDEIDYYYFDNTVAQDYIVDIDTIELGSDAQVYLNIFHEDDYGFTTEIVTDLSMNGDPMVSWYAERTGRYFITASPDVEPDPDSLDGELFMQGAYRITVRPASCLDINEPNDAAANATPFTLGATAQSDFCDSDGNSSTHDRVDYYSFEAQTGDRLSWNVTPIGSLSYTVFADIIAPSGAFAFSKLTESGTYLVKVYVSDDMETGLGFDYELSINTSSCAGVAEPNNTLGDATAITVNDNIDASLCDSGDVDYYTFTVAERTFVQFDLQNFSDAFRIVLTTSDGEAVWIDDVSESSDGYSHTIPLVLDTTYFLEFSSRGTVVDESRPYTLSVNSMMCDDSNEPNFDTTPINVGETANGTICLSGDADGFEFTADQNRIYDVTVSTDDPSATPELSIVQNNALYDSSASFPYALESADGGIYQLVVGDTQLQQGSYAYDITIVERGLLIPEECVSPLEPVVLALDETYTTSVCQETASYQYEIDPGTADIIVLTIEYDPNFPDIFVSSPSINAEYTFSSSSPSPYDTQSESGRVSATFDLREFEDYPLDPGELFEGYSLYFSPGFDDSIDYPDLFTYSISLSPYACTDSLEPNDTIDTASTATSPYPDGYMGPPATTESLFCPGDVDYFAIMAQANDVVALSADSFFSSLQLSLVDANNNPLSASPFNEYTIPETGTYYVVATAGDDVPLSGESYGFYYSGVSAPSTIPTVVTLDAMSSFNASYLHIVATVALMLIITTSYQRHRQVTKAYPTT